MSKELFANSNYKYVRRQRREIYKLGRKHNWHWYKLDGGGSSLDHFQISEPHPTGRHDFQTPAEQRHGSAAGTEARKPVHIFVGNLECGTEMGLPRTEETEDYCRTGLRVHFCIFWTWYRYLKIYRSKRQILYHIVHFTLFWIAQPLSRLHIRMDTRNASYLHAGPRASAILDFQIFGRPTSKRIRKRMIDRSPAHIHSLHDRRRHLS